MVTFSKRELEILKLQKEGMTNDEAIRMQLGMKDRKQVAVHRSSARRKVIAAKNFYQKAMREYGLILFPGTNKKYKSEN